MEARSSLNKATVGSHFIWGQTTTLRPGSRWALHHRGHGWHAGLDTAPTPARLGSTSLPIPIAGRPPWPGLTSLPEPRSNGCSFGRHQGCRTAGPDATASPALGAKIQMLNGWGLRSVRWDGFLLAPIWVAWAHFGRGRFGIAPGGRSGRGRGGAGNSWRQQRLQKAQLSAEPASACGQKPRPANIPEYSGAGEAPAARGPPRAGSGEREHATCSPACARPCLEPRRELRRKGRRGHRSTPSQEPSPCFN